eukprot:361799_1
MSWLTALLSAIVSRDEWDYDRVNEALSNPIINKMSINDVIFGSSTTKENAHCSIYEKTFTTGKKYLGCQSSHLMTQFGIIKNIFDHWPHIKTGSEHIQPKSANCEQCRSYSNNLMYFYLRLPDLYVLCAPRYFIEYLCADCSHKHCVKCNQILPRFAYKFCEICNEPICYNKTDMSPGIYAMKLWPPIFNLCNATNNHLCSNINGLKSAMLYLQSMLMNNKNILSNNIFVNYDFHKIIHKISLIAYNPTHYLNHMMGINVRDEIMCLLRYYDSLFANTNSLLLSAVSWNIFRKHCQKLYETP